MKLDFPSIGTWIIQNKRLIAIIAACLVGLLLLLYLFAGIDSCNFNRGQNTRKEAVNSALREISNIESNINAEKTRANQLIEQIKVDTKSHASAVNATDTQRLKVDEALTKWEAARSANQNVNISADELQELLRKLD